MTAEPMPDGAPDPPEPPADGTPDGLRAALFNVLPNLVPVYEFAEGQRVELERRGWSPSMAEAAAGTILVDLLHSVMLGGGR